MKQIPDVIVREIEEVRDGKREETILIWRGFPLLVTRATEGDVERVSKGYVCMD